MTHGHSQHAISGIWRENMLLPPLLIATVLSAFTAMAGASGTFILLIFRINILGFTVPAVSSKNFADNIVATPGGEYRYCKKGRMAWPRAWVVIVGSVLLYMGTHILFELSERAMA